MAAETYDGWLSDSASFPVTVGLALAALDDAKGGPVAEGNVGGGTGMICHEFKGGTGTASRLVRVDGASYTVGALVQATYGFEPKPSGELITLANAKNTPLGALFSSGMFHNLHGRAGLIPRTDLPAGWSPATHKQVTVWECVQHTARVLNAEDGGAAAAAALVAQMGQKADDARALAYRLFEIASHKGWAAEALVYNELAQEWRNLEDLASGVGAQKSGAAAQMNLL